MPSLPQPQLNTSPELEQLLGHILSQNNLTGMTTEQLLGHILQKLSENGQNTNAESLLGMSLLKLEEIAKELGKINGEAGQIKISDGGIITFRGLKGDKGEKGDQGEVGEKGDQGIQGEIGPQGDKGEKGDTIIGKRGERGPEGLKGDTGSEGKPGRNGKDGKDGKDGSPDTPKQIIAKIKGVLDYSDIKNAPEFRMGGTRPDSVSMAEVLAVVGTAGGIETPSGIRDGSNKDFTVLNVPKFITFNGQTWYEGAGYSILGLTITLSIAPNVITEPNPDIIRSHF